MISRLDARFSRSLLPIVGGAIIIVMLSFCSSVKNDKVSIKQGVSGRVIWMEGNFMPSPDRAPDRVGKPAVRTVYIYKETKLAQTEGEAPLFSKIEGDLIAKVKTNKEGYFQCKLSPGKYSIFTLEEDRKFFANLFDGDGNIASFEVKTNEVTKYNISVNYKAAF